MSSIALSQIRRYWKAYTTIVGLVGANLFAWNCLATSRQSAVDAGVVTGQAEKMIEEILSLRNERTTALTKIVSDSDLVRKIESSARTAQVPSSRLLRVTPESPQRFQDGDDMEQPVSLSFSQITLRQLMQFFTTLTSESDGVRVKGIRLSAPRDPTDLDSWKADTTISYWIYSPKTAAKKTGPTS